MTLEWEARWDSAQGEKVAAGRQDFTVEPGFHVTRQIAFKTPAIEKERNLVLVLKSLIDGKMVFTEERISYRIGLKE